MLPAGTKVRYRGFPLENSERFFTGIVDKTFIRQDVLMLTLKETSNPNNNYSECYAFPAYEFEILSSKSELIALSMNNK